MAQQPTLAVFGGSFSPPGLHHRAIVEELARHFDRVLLVPCGPRPDKPSTNEVDPIYRAALADIAFSGMDRVEVDLFDLEQATFTRTHALHERYKSRGEVWHVVGADLITGGRDGRSFIHTNWECGPELWKTLNFAVLKRPGHDLGPGDLPPKHKLIDVRFDGSSVTIREKIFRRESVEDIVSPQVREYVERHRLYRATLPARATRIAIQEPRLLIHFADRNARRASGEAVSEIRTPGRSQLRARYRRRRDDAPRDSETLAAARAVLWAQRGACRVPDEHRRRRARTFSAAGPGRATDADAVRRNARARRNDAQRPVV